MKAFKSMTMKKESSAIVTVSGRLITLLLTSEFVSTVKSLIAMEIRNYVFLELLMNTILILNGERVLAILKVLLELRNSLIIVIISLAGWAPWNSVKLIHLNWVTLPDKLPLIRTNIVFSMLITLAMMKSKIIPNFLCKIVGVSSNISLKLSANTQMANTSLLNKHTRAPLESLIFPQNNCDVNYIQKCFVL